MKQRWWWTQTEKDNFDEADFIHTCWRKEAIIEELNRERDPTETDLKLYNRLDCNYELANKKALFLNMYYYYKAKGLDPFDTLPVTIHIKHGLSDP